MKHILGPPTIGLAFALLLQLFYGMVKTRWPANYFSTEQMADYKVSLGWMRYLIFRVGPGYAVAVLVVSSASRMQVSVFWSVFSCCVIHLLSTVGRAILVDLRSKIVHRRIVIADSSVSVLVIFGFIVGGLTGHLWLPLVPGPDKYVEVFLTGLLAAGFFHYLTAWTSGRLDTQMLVQEYMKKVSCTLRDHVESECARHRVDPDLVFAVLITESVQRPKWFRGIERVLGKLGLAETQGLAQASRGHRTTNEESISEAVANLAGAVLPRADGRAPRDSLVRVYLDRHNKGQEFQDFAVEVFRWLNNEYGSVSGYVGNDGAPGLRAKKITRDGRLWVIRGDAASELKDVAVTLSGGNGELPSFRWAGVGVANRRQWEVHCPIEVSKVHMRGVGELAIRPREPDACYMELNFWN